MHLRSSDVSAFYFWGGLFTCFYFVVEPVVTIPPLAALDLGASFEQPFNCLIIQNRLAVQSMRRLMDWTLEADMVAGSDPASKLMGRGDFSNIW